MTSLGIDIGGTSVKMAAIELPAGTVLWTRQSPFYSRPTTEQLVDALRAAASGKISASDTFDAAGLCVPGL